MRPRNNRRASCLKSNRASPRIFPSPRSDAPLSLPAPNRKGAGQTQQKGSRTMFWAWQFSWFWASGSQWWEQLDAPDLAAPSAVVEGAAIEDVNLELLRGDRREGPYELDRKSTRLNSSHLGISYAVFCLK